MGFQVNRQRALLLCTVGLAVQANAESADPSYLTLGPGTYIAPSYPGASTSREIAFPYVDALYHNWLYSNATDLLGVYALKSADTQIGAALDDDLVRRRQQDDERLRGLPDVKETAKLKLFASQTVLFLTADVSSSSDIAGHGQGTVAQANLWITIPDIPHVSVSFGPGANWADHRYMRTFFSVSAAQAATSSLPAFEAHAGNPDRRLNAIATIDISSKWQVGLIGIFAHLHDDALASPVSLQRSQLQGLAWIAYKLY